MFGGNSSSERCEPDVVGSPGASWNSNTLLDVSIGSSALPRRSVSPFDSAVQLMPLSGISLASGNWPMTWPLKPDCCANGIFAFAWPRMSEAASTLTPPRAPDEEPALPAGKDCAPACEGSPPPPPPQPASATSNTTHEDFQSELLRRLF